MNIICNNCVGGRIYQLLNIEYNNPFMWIRIYYDSYKTIISDFDNINFKDIRFDNYLGKDEKYNHILINNTNIEINYTHYIQNSKFDKPTKQEKSPDIYYNDIQTYTINKYLQRLKRMDYSDKRIFILSDAENIHLTDNDIKDFLSLNLTGLKILITNKEKYIKYNNFGNIPSKFLIL